MRRIPLEDLSAKEAIYLAKVNRNFRFARYSEFVEILAKKAPMSYILNEVENPAYLELIKLFLAGLVENCKFKSLKYFCENSNIEKIYIVIYFHDIKKFTYKQITTTLKCVAENNIKISRFSYEDLYKKGSRTLKKYLESNMHNLIN